MRKITKEEVSNLLNQFDDFLDKEFPKGHAERKYALYYTLMFIAYLRSNAE